MDLLLAFLGGVGCTVLGMVAVVGALIRALRRAKEAAAAAVPLVSWEPRPTPGPTQRLLVAFRQRHLARQLNEVDQLLWLALGEHKRPWEGWRQ